MPISIKSLWKNPIFTMSYMNYLFSSCITGFRSLHGSHHCLEKMPENWKNALDTGGSFCALFKFKDLSKACDTVNHDFSKHGVTLMSRYLKSHKQRVAINSSTSTTKPVGTGVPQGSIDGSLLFNIFADNLVLFIESKILGNYTDDNNIRISGRSKKSYNRNCCFCTWKH